jgi:hypothetical protein
MLTNPSNAAEIAMAVIFNSNLLGIYGVNGWLMFGQWRCSPKRHADERVGAKTV